MKPSLPVLATFLAASLVSSCSSDPDSSRDSEASPDTTLSDTLVSSDSVDITNAIDSNSQPDSHTTDITNDATADQKDPPKSEHGLYLIITASTLEDGARGFADYRSAQGYEVHMTTLSDLLTSPNPDNETQAQAAKAWVMEQLEKYPDYKPHQRYLLLVGDATDTDSDPELFIPVFWWPGLWVPCWSDNQYALTSDIEHTPALAVGRIPARSVEDVNVVLQKVQQHENNYRVGPWNHRLNIYAGEGGFGEDIDLAIETIAAKGLQSVPQPYDIRFAYKSSKSTFYYRPFEQVVEELITSGSVLVTYMGHGGGELNVPNLQNLECQNRLPLATFFACSTGEFAEYDQCDSEAVLFYPKGPLAILVSTATTHLYANAINALETEASMFSPSAGSGAKVPKPTTFGQAMRLMKWRSMYNTDDLRSLLDSLAVLYIDADEMNDTNVDHLYSYNLLGDPATLIMLPTGTVELQAPETYPGTTLDFTGTVDNLSSGTAMVRIAAAHGTVVGKLQPIDDQSPDSLIQSNWEIANNRTVVSVDVQIVDGAFSGSLEIPVGTISGKYSITAYAYNEDTNMDAVGASPITIKKQPN